MPQAPGIIQTVAEQLPKLLPGLLPEVLPAVLDAIPQALPAIVPKVIPEVLPQVIPEILPQVEPQIIQAVTEQLPTLLPKLLPQLLPALIKQLPGMLGSIGQPGKPSPSPPIQSSPTPTSPSPQQSTPASPASPQPSSATPPSSPAPSTSPNPQMPSAASVVEQLPGLIGGLLGGASSADPSSQSGRRLLADSAQAAAAPASPPPEPSRLSADTNSTTMLAGFAGLTLANALLMLLFSYQGSQVSCCMHEVSADDVNSPACVAKVRHTLLPPSNAPIIGTIQQPSLLQLHAGNDQLAALSQYCAWLQSLLLHIVFRSNTDTVSCAEVNGTCACVAAGKR